MVAKLLNIAFEVSMIYIYIYIYIYVCVCVCIRDAHLERRTITEHFGCDHKLSLSIKIGEVRVRVSSMGQIVLFEIIFKVIVNFLNTLDLKTFILQLIPLGKV